MRPEHRSCLGVRVCGPNTALAWARAYAARTQLLLGRAHSCSRRRGAWGAADAAKPSLWVRFKNEMHHYWIGTKLLAAETSISARLSLKALRGGELTRRERKQVRTRSL